MLALPGTPLAGVSPSRFNRPPSFYASAGIALVIVTFGLLSLERRHSSSDPGATRIETFNDTPIPSSSHRSGKLVCDPHDLPGVLQLPEDHDALLGALDTHWLPLGESARTACPAQNYVKRVAALSTASNSNSTATDTQSHDDIPWALYNRTILLVGDSIDRGNAQYTCQLLGGQYESITPGHKYWPQADIHAQNDPIQGSWTPNEYSARSFPTLCHVPAIDLVVMSVFHFGMDTEEYFGWKDQVGPPYTVEARIGAIAERLAEKVGRKIDIMEFSTGLWDLARFGRQDDTALTAESSTTVRHLTTERLEWFTARFQSVLSLLTPSLENSSSEASSLSSLEQDGSLHPAPLLASVPQKYIRRLHISADDEAGSFQQWWQVAGGGSDGSKHTYYFPGWRIMELNAAIQSAVESVRASVQMQRHKGKEYGFSRYEKKQNKDDARAQEWHMDAWGDKLFGMDLFDKGNVHPHYAATTLWLEQMFYRLVNGS